MLALPQNKFLAVQQKFYQQVINLPPKISMSFPTVNSVGTNSYVEYLRAQGVTAAPVVDIKCLYKRNISVWDRKKYGLAEDIECIVYIPPQEMVTHFGGFQLDYKKAKIVFLDYKNDDVYYADKVIFKEPHYGSCITVELHLKNATP